MKIDLRVDATPVVEPGRKIPFAQYDKLKAELQRMEAMKVVENIEKATEWFNSFVPVNKLNKQLCVCVDPRNLNKSIKREHFKLRTRDEVTAHITNAKIFTKLNAGFGKRSLKTKVPIFVHSTPLLGNSNI